MLVSEWIDYVTPTVSSKLEVDKERKERMDIYLNITFHHMPCSIISLDVMDVSGDHQNEISHEVHKTRIDKDGARIKALPIKEAVGTTVSKNKNEGCYGAKEGTCKTCQDVLEAYSKQRWSAPDPKTIEQCVREGYMKNVSADEGCILDGKVSVNKVPGNFHIAPGRSYEQQRYHIHDISSIPTREFDFSYTINMLSFGKHVDGIVNPLENTKKIFDRKRMFMVQHYIKVVGTRYFYLNQEPTLTNQYSAQEFVKDVTQDVLEESNSIPGIFFHYEISPMVVINTETRKSFSYFITSVCAVVGGVFTVAGFLDAFLFRAERTLLRKARINKLG